MPYLKPLTSFELAGKHPDLGSLPTRTFSFDLKPGVTVHAAFSTSKLCQRRQGRHLLKARPSSYQEISEVMSLMAQTHPPDY